MGENKVHYYWLDLVRFTAAFLVLICHFRGAFFVEYTLLPAEQKNPLIFTLYSLTRLGNEAVLIFFVMSGFLVGGKAIERLQQGVFDIKGYAIDRTVRIMLPLISALLLFIPVSIVRNVDISWCAWLGNLFSLQGICTYSIIEPLWSLSYEVWFYILMGIISLFFVRQKMVFYKIFAIPLLLICFLVFTKLSPHYLFMWFMGALAYLIIPKKVDKIFLWGGFIVMICFIILLQLTSGSRLNEGTAISQYLPNRQALELLFAFFFSLFLQQLVIIKPTKKWTLKLNEIGTKLAAFSYTLYLTHVLVLRMLEYYNVPKSESVDFISISWYIGELTIALLVAYVVYWCFEKRTAEVKSWVKRKL